MVQLGSYSKSFSKSDSVFIFLSISFGFDKFEVLKNELALFILCVITLLWSLTSS